jgi:hypothetical protein
VEWAAADFVVLSTNHSRSCEFSFGSFLVGLSKRWKPISRPWRRLNVFVDLKIAFFRLD